MSPELHCMAERMAWGYVRRFFPHIPRADKEDLVQEGIIGVWRKGATVDQPKLASAICRTSIIDAARKMLGRYERARTALSHQVYLDAYEEHDQLLGHYEDDYPCIAESTLSRLRPRERAAVEMRLAGYDGQETGAALGVVPSRVSQHFADAKRLLAA